MDKKAIRLQMKTLAQQHPLSPEDTAALWSSLESYPGFADARTVLVYMSMPDEVPTEHFVAKWHTVKRLAIPLVCGENLLLKEYQRETLHRGYNGIVEPSSSAPDIKPEEVDFAIIPGVAFDSLNHRLGRGKGFYDRLLPSLHCPKIGICQSFRIIPRVPCESWDAPLDGVVTL